MLLLEHKLQFREIIGTDIDLDSLEKAEEAIYHANQVNQVPDPFLEKYFIPTNDRYAVIEDVKNMLRFLDIIYLLIPFPKILI